MMTKTLGIQQVAGRLGGQGMRLGLSQAAVRDVVRIRDPRGFDLTTSRYDQWGRP